MIKQVRAARGPGRFRVLWGMAALCLSSTALADQPSKRPVGMELGKLMWERHCQACHGELARGDGPAAADLVTEVPNLYKKIGKEKVEDLVRFVMRGEGMHPAYSTSLDERDEAKAVLDYLVALDEARLAKEKKDAEARAEKEAEGEEGTKAAKPTPAEAAKLAKEQAEKRRKAEAAREAAVKAREAATQDE